MFVLSWITIQPLSQGYSRITPTSFPQNNSGKVGCLLEHWVPFDHGGDNETQAEVSDIAKVIYVKVTRCRPPLGGQEPPLALAEAILIHWKWFDPAYREGCRNDQRIPGFTQVQLVQHRLSQVLKLFLVLWILRGIDWSGL
jgi:hypothetical protein